MMECVPPLELVDVLIERLRLLL